MAVLVDASVLCEPTKPAPNGDVVAWLRQNEPDIVVDPVILGEIHFRILLLPKGKRRTRLEHWFTKGVKIIRCLPWDADTGLVWAELLARLRATGRAMPIKDSMIAATALQHGLTLVTHNVRDFRASGVDVFDPFRRR